MTIEKKKKPVYTLNSFANNIVEEFNFYTHTTDGSAERYMGILIYGIEDEDILKDLSNAVSEMLKVSLISYPVIYSCNIPDDIPLFRRNSSQEGYMSVDLGWFIREGWIKDSALEEKGKRIEDRLSA